MAFAYKKLTEITTLPTTKAAIFTNSAATASYVRSIILHNTGTATESVELNMVPNLDGDTVSNQFYAANISPDETVFIEFPTPGLVMDTSGDAIEGVTSTVTTVTIMVMGGDE